MIAAQAASATTVHPDYFGPNYSFTSIQETSTFGDPEPLFGAPLGIGDSLQFTPPNFTASAAGAGDFDQTGAQLQVVITSTSVNPISELTIDEFGEVDLSGVGTAATGAFISMSGFVTVLETAGAVPCVGPSCVIGFTGIFSPSDLYGLPGDLGTTLFQGSVFVDVAAAVANATTVQLSFDNDITVFSEDGTTALMQKKPTIVVTAVPEPSTVLLLGGGLIGLSLRGRARKR